MSFDEHHNLARSVIQNSPGTGGTSITVKAGEGSWFSPAPFNATVGPPNTLLDVSNAEIFRVTNVVSDTLTVQRAQEGTTALNIAAGWVVGATVTAKALTDIEAYLPPAAGAFPVREIITGYHQPKAQSNFDNVSQPVVGTPGTDPFGTRFSDNTDGAWIEWYVALGPGTYTVEFRGYSYSGSGILVFSLDGTDIDQAPYNASSAAVDTYSLDDLAGQFFQAQVCNDLTIPAGAVMVLRATVTGKNAASTGFATVIQFVTLNRVG